MLIVNKFKSSQNMSSFLAHSIVGFTIGSQSKKATLKESIFVALFFILLASTPDIDYLINYLRGESMLIRYTHSLGYVFLIGVMALFCKNICLQKHLYSVPNFLFFLAPFSHLVLDFFVGVHGNPYLYPFSSSLFVSPLGIFPSAGRIDIHNHYFWRNILIELAIFLPFMFAFTPKIRAFLFGKKFLIFLFFAVFLIGLVVGFRLDR